MPKSAPGPSLEPRRCRCGHFPTTHMVVIPVAAAGGYRLATTGPCTVCGPELCSAFSRSPLEPGAGVPRSA